MKHKKEKLHFGVSYSIILFFLFSSGYGQSIKQEKMEQLAYMVGEWVGISTVYENGTISKQVPAYEKISYDLDKTILVIQLNSELLQLHTIIQYDEKDSTYYYHPFSKKGARKLPAEFKDGRLIVWSTDTNRFIFSKTSNEGFREYGERLIDGKWVKYFEDVFTNTQ